jgi:hypothetical protein
MTQRLILLRLLSDARIGAHFSVSKPALVLDSGGMLLFANRASLALLRTDSRRDVEAAIAADRGPFAAALRGLNDGPADAPQMHTLPLRIGGTRRAVQFSCSRIDLDGGGSVFLLAGVEPAGSLPDARSAAAAAFGDEEAPFALFAADGKKIYANASASNLIGGAAGLTEMIPGSQNALAKARSEGSAELGFGVLRILLRRIGAETDSFVAAAFTAPARDGETEEPAPLPAREAKPAAIAPEPAAIASRKSNKLNPSKRQYRMLKRRPRAQWHR